ncbi:MAG: MBL fold metallo-hydrolase, partial [Verrucomicrobiota bacterium]
ATPMLEAIRAHGLELKLILITHADSDHIADLNRLKRETDDPPTFTDTNEPVEGAEPIGEGAFFSVGGLGILAAETSGHSPGQLSYIIQGLDKPVAVVGDSIFAGSIGGAPNAWAEAIENCRKKLLSLDPQTILCPGHGPLTSVAEEVANNPILAA